MPLVVGSHNRFTPKFRFGALFGPNKELETHPAPFLDQLSVLEQKNSRRVPVAILRKSALVEKEIIIQLGSGTSVIEELSGYSKTVVTFLEYFMSGQVCPFPGLVSKTLCLIWISWSF